MTPQTRLLHLPPTSITPANYAAAMPPICRSSTIFHPNSDAVLHHDWRAGDYTYGIHGTPTTDALCSRIALADGATHALLVPSGLMAITVVDLALLNQGDEVLVPLNCYGNNRHFSDHFLSRFGIRAHYYDPLDITSAQKLITPRCKLLWLEAAGSNTLEFPPLGQWLDFAAQHQLLTAIDHTWGAGIAYQPFALRAKSAPQAALRTVDVAIGALTKYQSGAADVLMGSITTCRDDLFDRLQETTNALGSCVAANDVEAVLRGLPTMRLRYAAQDQTTRSLCAFLKTQPQIARVFHPSLDDSPGHAHWLEYCEGAAAILSFRLKDNTLENTQRFCDALHLFKLGYSWAGPISLAMFYRLQGPYWQALQIDRGSAGQYLIRLAIGLEDLDDLQADVAQALQKITTS